MLEESGHLLRATHHLPITTISIGRADVREVGSQEVGTFAGVPGKHCDDDINCDGSRGNDDHDSSF